MNNLPVERPSAKSANVILWVFIALMSCPALAAAAYVVFGNMHP